ncbi:MAG: hypothetical protein K6D37_12495 [Prevotella sp.]|nr:hypothetical protein [Prevotella sp.]
MTEKEILQLQEQNEQKVFYLIAVGMFYHAYGCGAFALARATGYRVLSKHRKGGDILTCGFPANQLDTVLQRIREAGSEVEQTAEKTFLFRGLDGTPDENMIAEQKFMLLYLYLHSGRVPLHAYSAPYPFTFRSSLRCN